jgi:hypothetical protein
MQGLPIVAMGHPAASAALATPPAAAAHPQPPGPRPAALAIRAFLAGKKERIRVGRGERYLKELNDRWWTGWRASCAS